MERAQIAGNDCVQRQNRKEIVAFIALAVIALAITVRLGWFTEKRSGLGFLLLMLVQASVCYMIGKGAFWMIWSTLVHHAPDWPEEQTINADGMMERNPRVVRYWRNIVVATIPLVVLGAWATFKTCWNERDHQHWVTGVDRFALVLPSMAFFLSTLLLLVVVWLDYRRAKYGYSTYDTEEADCDGI